MIDRFVLLRPCIESLLQYSVAARLDHNTWKAFDNIRLHEDEWRMLEYVREVLETLHLATNDLATESFTTISQSYPIFESLQDMCEGLVQEFDENIANNIDVVWYNQLKLATISLLKRVTDFYDKAAEKDAMIVPLLLHPQYGIKYVKKIWANHPDFVESAECESLCLTSHCTCLILIYLEKQWQRFWNAMGRRVPL